MPQLNIHWKGTPHRHLPRIRVPSLEYGIGASCRLAHIAALEVCRLPYSLSLQKARLQQRSMIRRRRRKSRRSLDGVPSPRRIAHGTTSNTWLSKPGVPCFNPIIKEEGQQNFADHFVLNTLSTSLHCTSSDVIGTDKNLSRTVAVSADTDNSLYQIHEARLDMVADLEAQREKNKQKSSVKTRGDARHDHPYLMPKVSKPNKTSLHDCRPISGSIRTFDPRIPSRRDHCHTMPTFSKHYAMNEFSGTNLVRTKTMDKLPISSDLLIRQATKAGTFHVLQGSVVRPQDLATLPLQKTTERMSLKSFKRGLERHLIAQEAVRKACLSHSSSFSSSVLSANTISELVPYIAEFSAAGLAVTSSEQRAALVLHSRNVRARNQKRANTKTGMEKINPIETHDGSGGRPRYGTKPSDVTLAAIANRIDSSTALVTSNKNIISKKLRLPWLRKAPAPSPPAKQTLADCTDTSKYMESPSASSCETCATTVIDFTPQTIAGRKEQTNPNIQLINIPLLDAESGDKDGTSLMTAINEIARPRPVVPERPVRALSRISGKCAQPLNLIAESSHHHEYTRLLNPGSKAKGKGKLHDNFDPQSNIIASPIAPAAPSGTYLGPFQISTQLRAPPKIQSAHDLDLVDIPQHVELTKKSETFPEEPPRPAHSPPLTSPNGHLLTPALTCQSPVASTSHGDSFETPSILEQSLNDVAMKSKLLQDQYAKREKPALNFPFNTSLSQSNCDPAKRKSTSWQSHWLSPRQLDDGEAKPLGFGGHGESRATISTDHYFIRDRDVVTGLQVALAAAYNKELDLQVMEISGYRVRKFLSDLKDFKGLGVNDLTNRAMQTARRRRGDRDQIASSPGHDTTHLHVKQPAQQLSRKRSAKIQPMVRDDYNARQGLLIAEMLRRRDERAGETVQERALAMGWRNRSVSAGN